MVGKTMGFTHGWVGYGLLQTYGLWYANYLPLPEGFVVSKIS